MNHSDHRKPGRGRVYDNYLEIVGNTPMVRVDKLCAAMNCTANIFAKLEFINPTASVKDRIAIAMIEALEADGLIGPDSVIVEPTAGNTGIAFASVCAVKDLRCILTMPDSFSVERRKLMSYFGAEVVLTPGERGIHGAIDKANQIVAETDNAVMPWQYGHEANPEIHRRTTAEEIWTDTGGQIDAVVIGVGTGGTLTGVGEVLKARNPDLLVVAIEPENSPAISGGRHSPHTIQGIGTGFVPATLNIDIIDEVLLVSDEESLQMARRLATLEGIPAGISSGACLAGAIRLGSQDRMEGRSIVAILPSCAERYLSTALFPITTEIR